MSPITVAIAFSGLLDLVFFLNAELHSMKYRLRVHPLARIHIYLQYY